MARTLLALAALVTVAGCSGGPGTSGGSLWGQTQVPPPGTGSITGADPAYAPSATEASKQTEATPASEDRVVSLPNPPEKTTGPNVPLGLPGDTIAIPLASREPNSSNASLGEDAVALREPDANRVINIASLPDADDPNVQVASATIGVRDASVQAASHHESVRFDYSSDYRWLQGRLEHSALTDQWKLRYIPIDGATDDYGGSVVITDPSALSGFSAGDYVRVEGRIVAPSRQDGEYSPHYAVERVGRQFSGN